MVVIGPSTPNLEVHATTVINPDPDTGRSASIRIGAAALTRTPGAILVQSVDQPVPALVLSRLFAAIEEGATVAVPRFRDRRGHPVCVSGKLLAELLVVDEETLGLRAVTQRHAVTQVPVEDEAVVWNLNDPAAYEAARPSA